MGGNEPSDNISTPQEDTAMPMPTAPLNNKRRLLIAIVVIAAISIGSGAGYITASNKTIVSQATNMVANVTKNAETNGTSQSAQASLSPQDIRDSSVGVIQPKPINQTTKQGSHVLKRDDAPWPIYLTSSTVDLSQYEGKHVKIYGVTFDGGTNDWYMEVNKVDTL